MRSEAIAASHHNRVFLGNPAGFVSTVTQIKGSSACNKEKVKTWADIVRTENATESKSQKGFVGNKNCHKSKVTGKLNITLIMFNLYPIQ